MHKVRNERQKNHRRLPKAVMVYLPLAFPAKATTPIKTGVEQVVRMSFWTMRLGHLLCPRVLTSLATANVLSWRYRLKVGWVDTTSVAAEMVKLESSWNCSDKHFICKAMGTKLSIPYFEITVALPRLPLPFPTSLRPFNAAPETLLDRLPWVDTFRHYFRPRGLSQYGDLHLGQILTCFWRGVHEWLHRLQVNIGNSKLVILPKSITYG